MKYLPESPISDTQGEERLVVPRKDGVPSCEAEAAGAGMGDSGDGRAQNHPWVSRRLAHKLLSSQRVSGRRAVKIFSARSLRPNIHNVITKKGVRENVRKRGMTS
jgi:hypothetical protein